MSIYDMREQLISAKKCLIQALEDNEKVYWANMKAWFKHQISKEEFDSESRRLLPKDKAYLHNQFLLAVLTKCQIATSSGAAKERETIHAANKEKKNKKIQALKRKFDHRFIAESPSTNLPPVAKPGKISLPALQQPIKTCTKTLEIPTATEMIGFVSVISWEMGLDDSTDEVVSIVTEAVRVFLKNLLTAVCSRRSAYKLYNNKFRYDMGHPPPNPYLLTRSPVGMVARAAVPEVEQENAETLARTSRDDTPSKYPVNMYDLYHCLQVDRSSVIPSHSIYSFAMERIISNLWHPDHDELKQDALFEKLTDCR